MARTVLGWHFWFPYLWGGRGGRLVFRAWQSPAQRIRAADSELFTVVSNLHSVHLCYAFFFSSSGPSPSPLFSTQSHTGDKVGIWDLHDVLSFLWLGWKECSDLLISSPLILTGFWNWHVCFKKEAKTTISCTEILNCFPKVCLCRAQ